jgi:PAS domain S-box-containing protein
VGCAVIDPDRGRPTPDQGEYRLQEVFDSAPLGMVISQPDGTITATNRALTTILRYPAAQLAGRDISELFHPDGAAALAVAYKGIIEGNQVPLWSRFKLLAANGDTVWVALTVSQLCDPAGNPTHHITMVEDFTDGSCLNCGFVTSHCMIC